MTITKYMCFASKKGHEVDRTNISPLRQYKNHCIILKILLLLPQAINSKNLIKKSIALVWYSQADAY